jgi:hypothetical protein
MVPGTGCSTLGVELEREFNAKYLPESDIIENGTVIIEKKHNTIPELLRHKLLSKEDLENSTVFATLRNPFDRFTTYFQRYDGTWLEEYFAWLERDYKRREKNLTEDERKDLRKKITKEKARKSRKQKLIRLSGFNWWILITILRKVIKAPLTLKKLNDFSFPMLEGVDYIIRQENLEDGVNALLAFKEIPVKLSIPVKNRTKGKKDYKSYYNWLTRTLLPILLKSSLRKTGYTFQGLSKDAKPLSKNPF